ncbi:potassium voltage-gated channel subfamily E regulatory beta subunit 5 [Rhineura floridana]|uniref:potassium voltage-gated channel subfamily E regulatory beta subunit 5 n=1 Tax=Rhineura floridana TaxID=261503 RepID=UPI002AC7E9D0|nr:potassium voltage-gated channel subfamily E regulatory beta subunit 5 [Rhineura floridana]
MLLVDGGERGRQPPPATPARTGKPAVEGGCGCLCPRQEGERDQRAGLWLDGAALQGEREGQRRGQSRAMNCSESQRLQLLLSRLWQELRGGGGGGAAASNASSSLDGSLSVPRQAAEGAAAAADDAYLYILLIMIFYGCLAGGLILAYTRSRKLESKHDPYHLYIERDWTARGGILGTGGGGGSIEAAAAATELSLDEGTSAAAAHHGERRSSGDDSEHL